MDNISRDILAVLTAIVSLAVIAVILSKKADTANVLTNAGNAFSKIIGAAVAPVNGAT